MAHRNPKLDTAIQTGPTCGPALDPAIQRLARALAVRQETSRKAESTWPPAVWVHPAQQHRLGKERAAVN